MQLDSRGSTRGDPMGSGHLAPDRQDEPIAEQRTAPRHTLLIRAAKITARTGEFVCVVRDVSDSGLSARFFHAPPRCEDVELHMPGAGSYALHRVWAGEAEAGYQFTEKVDSTALLAEASAYPKRALRLGLFIPVLLHPLTSGPEGARRAEGVFENLSQQGARLQSDDLFAIDQTLRIVQAGDEVPMAELRAKVRWRRDAHYGLIFDDTMSLGDFARLAVRAQCPALLNG